MPEDVKKIESLKGVEHIDKEPYMLDVQSIISTDLLTSSLRSWIDENEFASEQAFSKNETIIPNVKYVLMAAEKFSELTSINSEEELKNSVVIHIPGAKAEEKEKLQGEKLILFKASLLESEVVTNQWSFNIVKIMDTPFSTEYDANSNNNEITIILEEQAAIDYGITHGYIDLNIYVGDPLSKEESSVIYDNVYALTVGIPGSMFQYSPDLIFNYIRLADFLDFLGSFSFYVAVVLSILSISLVIFGKYRLQRRYWGIYRSLGLSENKLFYYLILELAVYYIAAIIISCVVYFCFLLMFDRMDYSLLSYYMFYISTIFSVLLMLVASAIII